MKKNENLITKPIMFYYRAIEKTSCLIITILLLLLPIIYAFMNFSAGTSNQILLSIFGCASLLDLGVFSILPLVYRFRTIKSSKAKLPLIILSFILIVSGPILFIPII